MDHKWVHLAAYSQVPPFAVVGGHDCDGTPIYVGRAYHEGDNLPAKVVPSKNNAYVCWGGREITKTHYEVLTGNHYRWIPCAAGSVPPNAVLAGNTVTGEPLYIGRGHWQGSLTVGKIHPSHHCLYIPFGGAEHRLDCYEVLTYEMSHHGHHPHHPSAPIIAVCPPALFPSVHTWLPASLTSMPPGAVVGGHDTDGSTIYVGRAHHDGEHLPCKVVPGKQSAYVSWGGKDIFKSNFEVLTGHGYHWITGHHHGEIPAAAVSTGRTRNGEPVYVGRGHHHGSLTPGKVHPYEYCVYIAYGGKEIKLKTYEILVKSF
ncbi:uncharacterized protein LOC129921410 [Episyrphus balteatus]|uniref:uncharacterized protein LOC129921410 n=1 Tax=Episyrphus balteatus TaxID=286459 RepID=UPI002485EB81|nr:uncharacterized protein LOC129921410 [Episyrphus balteatus]